MADFFSGSDSVQAPARKLVDITAADSDLTNVTKGIYVGGAGTLVITAVDDTASVTVTATAGSYHPIRAKRIAAASTATGIVGLY